MKAGSRLISYFPLDQRAAAANRAISDLRSALSRSARFLPPLDPNACAAGSFCAPRLSSASESISADCSSEVRFRVMDAFRSVDQLSLLQRIQSDIDDPIFEQIELPLCRFFAAGPIGEPLSDRRYRCFCVHLRDQPVDGC